MVVSSKQRHGLSGASNIDVRLGNENIKQIDCIDYLGVKLDAHLKWNEQIDAVCKKLVFTISRLSRLRHVLTPRILLYIYQGIIQPVASRRTRGPIDNISFGALSGLSQIIEIIVVLRLLRVFRIV